MVEMTAWPVWRSCLPTRGVPVAEVARVNRCRAAIAQVRAPSDTAAAVARVGEFARDAAAGRRGAARVPGGTHWRVPHVPGSDGDPPTQQPLSGVGPRVSPRTRRGACA